MEELFDLLEDGEELEQERTELRVSRPEQVAQRENTEVPAESRQRGEELLKKENREEVFDEESADRGAASPGTGDLAERILTAAEESALASQRRESVFDWRSGGTPERWYEDMRRSITGTEQLYLGINASRLRGSEPGARNVVIQMGESGAASGRADGTDIRALDRVFQRDARRYDGGLSPL